MDGLCMYNIYIVASMCPVAPTHRSSSQERPRIYFQRTVTARLEKARSDSVRARYLRTNPVDPNKKDLVVPPSEVYTKMVIAFSGLLFMVRLVILVIMFSSSVPRC